MSEPYPTCPTCWNPGEKTSQDGPLVRCINGHEWAPELLPR
ncbi:hypothetical protein [Streptosporangium sp. CA-115845]